MPHASPTADQLCCTASLKPPFPFPLQLHPLGILMLPAYTWGPHDFITPNSFSLSWKISSVITFWLCHPLAQKQIILHCLPNEIQNQVHIHTAAPSSLCGSPPGSTSFYSPSLGSGPVVLLLDLASQYIQRVFWIHRKAWIYPQKFWPNQSQEVPFIRKFFLLTCW